MQAFKYEFCFHIIKLKWRFLLEPLQKKKSIIIPRKMGLGMSWNKIVSIELVLELESTIKTYLFYVGNLMNWRPFEWHQYTYFKRIGHVTEAIQLNFLNASLFRTRILDRYWPILYVPSFSSHLYTSWWTDLCKVLRGSRSLSRIEFTCPILVM